MKKLLLLCVLAVNSVCASGAIVGLGAFALLSDKRQRDQMIFDTKRALCKTFIGSVERCFHNNRVLWYEEGPRVDPIKTGLFLSEVSHIATYAILNHFFNKKNDFVFNVGFFIVGAFVGFKVGMRWAYFYDAQRDAIMNFLQNNSQIKKIHISCPRQF